MDMLMTDITIYNISKNRAEILLNPNNGIVPYTYIIRISKNDIPGVKPENLFGVVFYDGFKQRFKHFRVIKVKKNHWRRKHQKDSESVSFVQVLRQKSGGHRVIPYEPKLSGEKQITKKIKFFPGYIGFTFKENIITKVVPHTQAEKAGVRVGWIIMEVNGTKITSNQIIIKQAIQKTHEMGQPTIISFQEQTMDEEYKKMPLCLWTIPDWENWCISQRGSEKSQSTETMEELKSVSLSSRASQNITDNINIIVPKENEISIENVQKKTKRVVFQPGYIGFVFQQNTVTEVFPSTPAEKAGVQVGWLIIDINGEKQTGDEITIKEAMQRNYYTGNSTTILFEEATITTTTTTTVTITTITTTSTAATTTTIITTTTTTTNNTIITTTTTTTISMIATTATTTTTVATTTTTITITITAAATITTTTTTTTTTYEVFNPRSIESTYTFNFVTNTKEPWGCVINDTVYWSMWYIGTVEIKQQAARLGLEVGDKIISIDNIVMNSCNHTSFMKKLVLGVACSITIKRQLSGYLEKKNFSDSDVWKKRFFMFEGNQLVYFRDTVSRIKGRILITSWGCEIEKSNFDNEFHIHTQEGIYYLRTKTIEQRDEWINALEVLRNMMSGYLQKKSKHSMKWKKRYLMLEGNSILYSRNISRKIKGRILLTSSGCIIRRQKFEKEFEIQTPTRIYHFRSSTKEKIDKWIRAFENVRLVPTNGINSDTKYHQPKTHTPLIDEGDNKS